MKVGKRTRRPPDSPVRTDESGILEAALDAIITADHEGRILSFNRAAEHIFGYARGSAAVM